MPNIGVIDDREDLRTTLVANIRLELEEEEETHWRVQEASPLESIEEYPAWIHENEIATLVVDERLAEQGPGVTYAGHDVVEYLRKRLPTLPIFVVTSHADEVLDEAKKDVEAIVPRDQFTDEPAIYVTRMVRAGRKYVEEFERELAELSAISRRIVAGDATGVEIRRADAIREELARSPDERDALTRVEWLEKVGHELEKLEELKNEIEEKIRSSKTSKVRAKKPRRKK
jgi:hypothetical protein